MVDGEAETSETINQSSEKWFGLGHETKKLFNQILANEGYSVTRAVEAIVLLNPEEGRVDKINVAITHALLSLQSEASRSMSLPAGMMITNLNENEIDMAVVFVKNASFKDDEYNQSRSQMLKRTNSLLEIFREPPLPPYTSERREKL